ncbi:MAG: GxxExxY protein [Pseudomonadota bacterium]
MHADEKRINAISERVIGCAQRISNTLGCGFLERVYENAMTHELRKAGLKAEQQIRFPVVYDGVNLGEYVADLVVEDMVIVETKAVKVLDDIHMAQCLNYLKATDLRLGLLLNFGTPKVTVRRVVNNL